MLRLAQRVTGSMANSKDQQIYTKQSWLLYDWSREQSMLFIMLGFALGEEKKDKSKQEGNDIQHNDTSSIWQRLVVSAKLLLLLTGRETSSYLLTPAVVSKEEVGSRASSI